MNTIETIDLEAAKPRRARRRKTAEQPSLPLTEAAPIVQEQQPSTPPIELTPQECGYLYALLGRVEALVATIATKCPSELAQKHFCFSSSECTLLAEPTAKVLNKIGGAALAKRKEEFLLIALLAAIHQAKLQAFSADLKKYREEKFKEDEKRNHLRQTETGEEYFSVSASVE